MKHLIIALALIGATSTASFAQAGLQDDSFTPPSAAVILQGKQMMIAKTAEMDKALAKGSEDKASALASQVLRQMISRCSQVSNTARTLPQPQQDSMMNHMRAIEARVVRFRDAAKDVKANRATLVAVSQEMTNDY